MKILQGNHPNENGVTENDKVEVFSRIFRYHHLSTNQSRGNKFSQCLKVSSQKAGNETSCIGELSTLTSKLTPVAKHSAD